MKLRPTIFLSGVSSEFGSFRDAVEIEIQKKGCFAENQSSFAPDYRTVEAMLRQRLREADAVIHIVGFRFGAEPKDRPADKPRRSYTQMEFDIAREMEKPVYVFLSADPTVRDEPAAAEKPDDPEFAALQLAHRQAVQNTNYLYYFFKDKRELCQLAAEIPQVVTFDFRADILRIDKYAPAKLIGRDDELALLNDAWLKVRRSESPRRRVITFVALGGEGKTSLVAKWAAELADQDWPGCDAAFAWSFYSQGTREQAASSDLFLKEAITFFGNEDDKQFAASNSDAYEKGQHLARIVGHRRALLILDGLEPLQYAPTSPTPGELKDSGIAALLKSLAARSDGLCIVTTRYSLPNLKAFWQTTALEKPLTRLSQAAGIHLLKTLGVNGSASEFKTLVEEVKGHALTLNLLGTYLRDAHAGDIRRRDLIRLEEANAEEQGGHAFRVIDAYKVAFEKEGNKGQRALAILRLLGLFDRPVSANCLVALLQEPPITGLTELLVGLSDAQRNLAFKRLEDAKLLTMNCEASGALKSLDAHPLLREYFAIKLRTQYPDTWRAAHKRLYEHLCATTPDKDQPTLEDLQPLYQAVAHGCQAGLQQEVCVDVYSERIRRKSQDYVSRQLGAYGSELEAVTGFFEIPWSRPASSLAEYYKAWFLAIAAYDLRALGRLRDAVEPMSASLKMRVQQDSWKNAAINACNLSELQLTLGHIGEAVKYAEQSLRYADRLDDLSERIIDLATHANALHQEGRWSEAESRFRQAEEMQGKLQPEYPLLCSAIGFQYCDLHLVIPERSAWGRTLKWELSRLVDSDLNSNSSPKAKLVEEIRFRRDESAYSTELRMVSQHAMQTLNWMRGQSGPLHEALDHLTLGRVALYEAVLSSSDLLSIEESNSKIMLQDAVNGLRRAGTMHHLPEGLLTRAWMRFLFGVRIGSESAQEDLDEAWEIAERGPMRLYMADIHLYRARLFFREKEYPWESPEADLKAAEKLINECGYHRRDEELADAKRVILGQSV